MKRTTFLKSLLLAAGLTVGASAWAETVTTVGNTDNSTGWWTAFSDYYTIEPHSTLKVTFTNHTDKSENWMNYIGVITTDADRNADGYSEYVVMRADCYGWQGELNTNDNTSWFTSNTNDYDWTTFTNDMDGATVVMTVKRQAAVVTLVFDVTTTSSTKYEHTFVMNCGDGTQNIRAFLTTQQGHLTGISSTKWDNEGLNYESTYALPTDYAIKNVFIGTLNGDETSVAPETFEDVTSLPSAWSANTVNDISIQWIDKITTVSAGSIVNNKPTYVGGNTMRANLRKGTSTGMCYAQYTLSEAVSKGKLFFGADIFANNNTSGAVYLRFLDSSDNVILTLTPNYSNSNFNKLRYQVGGTGDDTDLVGSTNWQNYQGYGIRDMVFDMSTGKVDLVLDHTARGSVNGSTEWYRSILTSNGTIDIGTGKNIAKVQIGKAAVSSTNLYFYMDNVQLFSMEEQYDYTINYKVGGATVKTVTGVAFEDDVISAEAYFTIDDVTYTPVEGETTSMTISSTEEDNVLNVAVAASVPYSISYKYNGETIKSESGYAITGNTVDATYTTSLWNEAADTKYYVADAAPTTFTIAASGHDFTVALRLAATDAVATINAVCDETTHKTFTATGIEGEEVTIYYSIAVQSDVDSKFYTVTTNDYSKTLTYGSSTDVAYTLDETIVGFTDVIYNPNSGSYSGGGYTAVNTKLAEATVDAGLYRAEIMVISKAGSGSNHRNEAVFVADERVASLSGNVNGLRTLDFVVPSNNTTVFVRGIGTSNYSDNLDYVIIRKTGDLPSTVTATITDCGWNTFASSYNLDLSNITNGTAYYASAASGSTVTLTTTTATVPAGEGIMIKGTAGATFTINVTSDAASAISGNLLIGLTATTTVAASAEGAYHYVFGYNTSDATEYGFYNLESSTSVPAGKAYLETEEALTAASGARIAIVFDGETQGIESVNANVNLNDDCYDLQGRRVAQPQKGLYIVGGKKVVMK